MSTAIDPTPYLTLAVNRTESVDLDRIVRVLELKIAGAWTDEGGALKWTRADWQHETNLPFILSQRQPQSRYIARQRVQRWADCLQRFDVPVTPTILAMCWERRLAFAMTRTKRGKPTAFAVECNTLYENLGC